LGPKIQKGKIIMEVIEVFKKLAIVFSAALLLATAILSIAGCGNASPETAQVQEQNPYAVEKISSISGSGIRGSFFGSEESQKELSVSHQLIGKTGVYIVITNLTNHEINTVYGKNFVINIVFKDGKGMIIDSFPLPLIIAPRKTLSLPIYFPTNAGVTSYEIWLKNQ